MFDSRMRSYWWILLLSAACAVSFSIGGSSSYSQEATYEDAARDFVAQCRKDPNVFIFTPMKDINSLEELEKLCHKIADANSCLMLDLDNMPVRFESKINGGISKVEKTWYRSGRLMSEEFFAAEEKLLNGTYYDCNGVVISQVERGKGKRFVFDWGTPGEGKIIATIEYVDGLKDGMECIFQDYEKSLKRKETPYKQGKPHGKSIGWHSAGGLNWEKWYEEGIPHGESICWYPNGCLQSVFTYKYGKIVGTWTIYYENGQKAREHSDWNEKKWYPSGQLMSDITSHEPDDKWTISVVYEGVSYDLLGNETGRVSNEVGYLVEADSDIRDYWLRIFRKHYGDKTIKIPTPAWTGGYSGRRLDAKIKIEAPENFALENIRVEFLVPDDCKCDQTLIFYREVIKAGDSEVIGDFEIQFPVPYDKWTGKLLVDIQADISGCRIRYQHPIFSFTKRNKVN